MDNPCTEAVTGFEDVKPMVFAGVYPVDTEDYEELRFSMEKLQLTDASLVFEPESSGRTRVWIPLRFLRHAPHGNCAGET